MVIPSFRVYFQFKGRTHTWGNMNSYSFKLKIVLKILYNSYFNELLDIFLLSLSTFSTFPGFNSQPPGRYCHPPCNPGHVPRPPHSLAFPLAFRSSQGKSNLEIFEFKASRISLQYFYLLLTEHLLVLYSFITYYFQAVFPGPTPALLISSSFPQAPEQTRGRRVYCSTTLSLPLVFPTLHHSQRVGGEGPPFPQHLLGHILQRVSVQDQAGLTSSANSRCSNLKLEC